MSLPTAVAAPLPAITEQHVALAETNATFSSAMHVVDEQLRQVMPALMELLADAREAKLPVPIIDFGENAPKRLRDGKITNARVEVWDVRWMRRRYGFKRPAGHERALVLAFTDFEHAYTNDYLVFEPDGADETASRANDGSLRYGSYASWNNSSEAMRAVLATELPRIVAEIQQVQTRRRDLGVQALAAMQQVEGLLG